MIWLSGALGRVLEAPRRWDIGVMCTPGSTARPQLNLIRRSGIFWAIDNQVFGGAFDPDRWSAWLARVPRAARLTCLFAVAPDVLHRHQDAAGKWQVRGDPEATFALSPQYFPLLRSLGYRVAFVSQDGATSDLVPWESGGGIDALFIGGSTEWKFSDQSISLIQEAQERGLWVHVGRCQPGPRMKTAHALGCDSADGTVLKHDPARLPQASRNITAVNLQPSLLTFAAQPSQLDQ